VIENAPQYSNEFGKRYSSSMFLCDINGRKLYQTELASGIRTFNEDSMYFLRMTDEQVREIDPATDLYPVMLLASGQTSDLSAVYYLLRRNPSLVNRGFVNNRKRKKSQSTAQRGRKRRSKSAAAMK